MTFYLWIRLTVSPFVSLTFRHIQPSWKLKQSRTQVIRVSYSCVLFVAYFDCAFVKPTSSDVDFHSIQAMKKE